MEVLLCTGSYDHTIRFWEALSGICVRTIQHQDGNINRLSISNDKRFLGVASNPHLRLYDAMSSSANTPLTKQITSFEGHSGNVTAVQFQASSRWLVSSSEDGSVKIWDLRAPNVQRDFHLGCAVNDVAIHPNQGMFYTLMSGEIVTCDQNGSIKIWDLAENQCTMELVPEEDVPARSVSISPTGSFLVAANNKGNYYVYSIKDRNAISDIEPAFKVSAHNKYVTKCLLSPDAKYLATCAADHTVKLWNTHVPALTDSAQPMASQSDLTKQFSLEKTLSGHQRWVWDCALSADSAYLVTCSSDHSARLWDLSTGETIRHYNGHQKAVVCVALHDVSL